MIATKLQLTNARKKFETLFKTVLDVFILCFYTTSTGKILRKNYSFHVK